MAMRSMGCLRGLAVLVEEGAINLELVPRDALKAQALTGASLGRRRPRLKALAAAAASRVQELRTALTAMIPSPMNATPGRREGGPRSKKVCALMRRSRR